MPSLKNYEKIVGKGVVDEICKKAKKLAKYHILTINSTYQGGGVAEILNSIMILFHEVGMDFDWRVLHGTPDFFSATKKIHNALQGEEVGFSEREKNVYREINQRFSMFTHLRHDLVFVHDPQPLPLIDFYEKKVPWISRFHIDLSGPDPAVWNYVKKFIRKYDHFVVSMEEYKKKLNIPQSVIYPAIDPFSLKNKPISLGVINQHLSKYKIKRNKPIIAQASRFDKWKDPIGVVKVFELVRERADCGLVLLGNFASDDPEGLYEFERLRKKIEKSKYKNDIHIVTAKNADNDYLVNAIQTTADVIIQKSIREGFGLTVTEAMYKGTPVVASNVGGIPIQIIDGFNGFLCDPNDFEGFSRIITELLKDKKLRKEIGENGKEYVKNNFLITRLMLDWLNLFAKYLK